MLETDPLWVLTALIILHLVKSYKIGCSVPTKPQHLICLHSPTDYFSTRNPWSPLCVVRSTSRSLFSILDPIKWCWRHRTHWLLFCRQPLLYLCCPWIDILLLVARKMVILDSFAIPKTNHWVHCATNDFPRWGVSTSAYPLLMTILLAEQFSNVFATISAWSHDYKLYSRRPWSALPVTKLFLPTAKEKTGCPWAGVHIMESMGPFRHCDCKAIGNNDKNYGVAGSWTQGLVHAKHALYQLSYNPVVTTHTPSHQYGSSNKLS